MKDDPIFPELSTSTGWQNKEGGFSMDHTSLYGLTKREHFAGLAMHAFLSNPLISNTGSDSTWSELACSSTAKVAIRMADALIAELEKKNEHL